MKENRIKNVSYKLLLSLLLSLLFQLLYAANQFSNESVVLLEAGVEFIEQGFVGPIICHQVEIRVIANNIIITPRSNNINN